MTPTDNLLIDRLPPAVRRALLARCEAVPLNFGLQLGANGDAGAGSRHAYFPCSGFVSLLVPMDRHPPLEIGMIGREGLLGLELVLGSDLAPTQLLVQGAGRALRLRAEDLRPLLAAHPVLQALLLRYAGVRLRQLGTGVACQRFHAIAPRLARWLLMSQDRAQSAEFHLTQELLAFMLGVRRVGVTGAAGALQRRGLIRYHRGAMQVLDRAGLEAAACSCYAADLASYQALG